MTLVKTSLINGIATAIKMLVMLLVNKILAIYVGPSGYAIIGQFQNAIQMVMSFSGGAINNGVIKYTAEYADEPEKQKLLWQTSGSLTVLSSIAVCVLISFFNQHLAELFLNDATLGGVFVLFAVGLLFFALNYLLLAILNGKKEIIAYVKANIMGSLLMLFIASAMTMTWGLYGALIALATYQSFAFFATIWICKKQSWFQITTLIGKINKEISINLSKFVLMALVATTCVPVSQMVIRGYLIEHINMQAAGYWEAMWRLSSAYLMFLTTTLSVYFLPRLSELTNKEDIKKEMFQGYKFLIPVVSIMGLVIYLLRDFIILVLFSADFYPMRELFAWQMFGDTIKIASWILAYLMLAKAMYKVFIVTEILFSLLWVGLSFSCVNHFGLDGAVIAYAINYLLYFLVMIVVIHVTLIENKEST